MPIVEYCSQNNHDCSTCSLVNHGHDCHNNPICKEVIDKQIELINKLIDENPNVKDRIAVLKTHKIEVEIYGLGSSEVGTIKKCPPTHETSVQLSVGKGKHNHAYHAMIYGGDCNYFYTGG